MIGVPRSDLTLRDFDHLGTLGPLGQVVRVVAMSVRPFVCPLQMRFLFKLTKVFRCEI